MNCLLFNNTSCSLKQTSTIVLFYKRLKGLSFRSHNAKFWFELYLVANSRRQVFSWRGSYIYPVWHLLNYYQTKSGQKTHPYTFSLLKNFQYHQNNKSITCTLCMQQKDLKYMTNLFDVHITVKVWNQYCFCIFHSIKHYFMVKWRKAHPRLGTSSNMWAAAWQNQQNDVCAEETLINLGICPVRMKNLALLATIECTVFAGRTGHFVGCT